MGKVFDAHRRKLAAWIGRQRMFFVGTAPSGDGGHVNVSPKGPIESLRILDPHTVAYQDVIGSGAETIAHLRDNGRIVVMLCAFEGPPRILRLHGRGTVLAGRRRRVPRLDPAARHRARGDPGRRRADRRLVRLRRAASWSTSARARSTRRGPRPSCRKGGERALDEYVARAERRAASTGCPPSDLEPA